MLPLLPHGGLIDMMRTPDRLRVSLTAAACCVLLAHAGCTQMTSTALNAEGVRLYQTGDYRNSMDKFNKAIAANPKEATSYYNMAAALHKNGKLYNRPEDLQQAERLYNQCLDYDGDHAECYRGLTVLLTETGRQDSAFRLLEGWAGRSPQNPESRIELARLLEETQNYPQATTRLVEALSIDPQNARALTALGRLREMAGDQSQALANYQRSLNVNRFQPEVAARVAALQASGAGVAPMMAAPATTRTVERWTGAVRY
ncbi:MAG: tetratricopeptide repeat protein [Planctomycetales bacterium]|nr:tetratricopeptide repeat protein [Planctomycetales bacterium]